MNKSITSGKKGRYLDPFKGFLHVVTFYTHAKVVGIMCQNAESFSFFPLAVCVQNLL